MRLMISRYRRALAALFAAAAAALALTAADHHPRGVLVLVAAHDIRPGTILGRGDVTPREFPAGMVPSGAVRRAEGRAVSGPVRRGEPLTDARFGSDGRFGTGTRFGSDARFGTDGRFGAGTRLGTGTRFGPGGLLGTHDPAAVAVPIRLADAAVARLLHPGDQVDILAARADAPSPARTVASAVPVMAVPKPSPDIDEGALIVVQTGRDQAALLARASVGSRLSVSILGPEP